MGSVVSVNVHDCDTNKEINITNIDIGKILVDIPDGNECVYFNKLNNAF
jgi:hypothetical protein